MYILGKSAVFSPLLGQNDALSLEDMVNLALVAARMKYMDCSVEFLRGLQKLRIDRLKESEVIKSVIKKIRKDIISTHNEIFKKSLKRIGTDFRGKTVAVKFESRP